MKDGGGKRGGKSVPNWVGFVASSPMNFDKAISVRVCRRTQLRISQHGAWRCSLKDTVPY